MVTRRLALRWRNRRADRRFAGQLRRLLPVLLDPGHVDVGNEIVGVGAFEHEHLDGGVGLGLLHEGDQIADQFGPEKIHGRSPNFREQNGLFFAHLERLENHGAIVDGHAARGGCLRDDGAFTLGHGHGLAVGREEKTKRPNASAATVAATRLVMPTKTSDAETTAIDAMC